MEDESKEMEIKTAKLDGYFSVQIFLYFCNAMYIFCSV
jgi:hypothetical protein